MTYHFDLTIPAHAYLFGFLQADGHLSRATRNRGKIRIELKVGDRSILEEFKRLLPVYSSVTTRERDTNFKKKYQSAIWTLCDQELREILNLLGLPYGKKSANITLPPFPFSEADYFRGIIDGDGSLGLTGKGFPFLSLTTKSRLFTLAYLDLVKRLTGKVKKAKPNTRDQIYNICVYKEDAQSLATFLYYPECLCLDRKAAQAQRVNQWIRPSNMVKVTWERRRWTSDEDAVVRALPLLVAAEQLSRTERSVRVRRSRLNQQTTL